MDECEPLPPPPMLLPPPNSPTEFTLTSLARFAAGRPSDRAFSVICCACCNVFDAEA